MGDENSPLSEPEVRHLLRRTGFGALQRDVDTIFNFHNTRGEAADYLLGFNPARFKPPGRDFETAHARWIKYMIRTPSPIQQKLVLNWHDHFATGFTKVMNELGEQDAALLMSNQIQTLHELCKGDFRELVKAINTDPAMIEFLDTERNGKDIPNENYARELQELFTVGVLDTAGTANYVQEDIVQIARAFTGLRHDGTKVFLDEGEHDYNSEFLATRGPKVIYKSTGGFGPSGKPFDDQGESTPVNPTAEIDRVIDVIFMHRDSDGKNTVARRIARRFLEYFAHPAPDTAVVDAVVAQSSFDTTFDIRTLMRAILVHNDFYATAAIPPFNGSTEKSVKWPIDYFVGTLRLLGMKLKSRAQYVDGGDGRTARQYLEDMGQLLLDPPSVFGWDWETSWISSSTLLARYSFAKDVISARGGGSTAFRPDRLVDLGLTDPVQIVDAVTDLLGVTDQLTSTEKTALTDYLTDNGANPTINLNDYTVRNTKLNGLFGLVMESPAYQVH